MGWDGMEHKEVIAKRKNPTGADITDRCHNKSRIDARLDHGSTADEIADQWQINFEDRSEAILNHGSIKGQNKDRCYRSSVKSTPDASCNTEFENKANGRLDVRWNHKSKPDKIKKLGSPIKSQIDAR